MKILKILFLFILIYFIRRFIEMYRVMKQMQLQQKNFTHDSFQKTKNPPESAAEVINAEYKIID